jgi:seryl-tRNA synthetase
MHDLREIVQDPELFQKRLSRRGQEFPQLTEVLKLATERRELNVSLDKVRQEQAKANQQMKALAQAGDRAAIDSARAAMRGQADELKTSEDRMKVIEEQISGLLMHLPNVPMEGLPEGGESANHEARRVGTPRVFDFEVKDHHDLGEKLGVLDFARGARLAQSRFTVMRGAAARLERALVTFMIDVHTSRGYQEVLTPVIVNRATMTGTGQLPKFEDDLFKIADSELFLIPTAEVPVTNLYAGEVLDGATLTQKFCAYSACFRKEAGSYGRDTRGLIRQHQFDKVELVKFAAPENSNDELEGMVADAEEILKRLELPYRVMTLATGDMGFASQKTYDIEVWLPSQNAYREISSCSNCGSFQARRADIRFKRDQGKGKPEFVHTLNGSGLAVGRTLIAIMENYQEADGSFVVPTALRPYVGGLSRVTDNR